MTEFATAMQKMQFDALVELTEKRNALVAQINAATGDRDSLAESIKESSEFEDLRVKIAELMDELDAKVALKVDEALANVSGDTEALTAEYKEIDSTLKPGIAYYKKLYTDEAAEALPKLDRVKGVRSSSGGATGGRRVRGYNVIVTDAEGDATEFENFASAGKFLDIPTADLQQQFFAKAGVEKLSDAPEVVEFTVSWTEVDENDNETEASATVKAYRTGTSGVPKKDESPSPEVTEDATSLDEDALSSI